VAVPDIPADTGFPKVYTGRVEELDWSAGSIGIKLGQPAYNLVDAVRGPEIAEERTRNASGVAQPAGLTVAPASPGVVLKVNPFFESSVVGIEVYGNKQATAPGNLDDFVQRDNFLARGSANRFEFPNLDSGEKYFFTVRSYDANGGFSEPVPAVSATAGFIPRGKIAGLTVDDGVGSESFTDSVSFVAGDVVSQSGGSAFVVNGSSAFTVPAGKVWQFMFTTNSVGFGGSATPVNYELGFAATDTASSTVVKNRFPAGDYSGLEFVYAYDAYCFAGGSSLSFSAGFSWVVFELDA